MSEEGYKVQVSVKLGTNQAGMLNIRGDSTEEVDALLRGAEELLLPNLAGFESAAKAVGLIADAFPGTGPVQQGAPAYSQGPQQGYQQPAQQPAAAQNGGGQGCVHGAMIFRQGQGQNGNWAGWFCSADRNDPNKCKPRYQR